MRTKLSESRVFLTIVALTLSALIGWGILLVIIWLLIGRHVNPEFWAMVEALSTAVAAAAVVSAGYIAYRELSEGANSRYIEVSSRLFDELNSTANIESRRWVYLHLDGNLDHGLELIDDEGQAHMKQVLNSLDKVSFLTQSTWIPDEIIMPWMHPMITKSWAKLAPYVMYERQRRKEPYYYRHAEQLAERCATWRLTHVPQTTIEWVDDAL